MATQVNDSPIVDADAHVNPFPDFWSDYLPAHLRDLAPRIEHGDESEDCDYVVFEGRRKKLNLIGAQAGRKGKDFKINGRASDARSGGWEPAARLEDMNTDGIDAALLFGGGPLGTGNNELFQASFDAYNTWLADFCDYAPGRLGGVGYVPMQDVGESIRMMRDFARRGLKAVNIPAFPMSATSLASAGAGAAQTLALTGDTSGARTYADPEFDPFWQAAIELGLPVTIHLGGRSVRFLEPQHFLPDLLMSKFAMAEPIAVLIFGGVFQRFPDLRFVSVESGVGWFAFAADYMDKTWEKQRFWTKSVLEQPPSHFMEQNVFGSFIHDAPGVAMRHLPGAKNIMWSSDYPHSETTFPDSHKVIDQLFAGVPDDERKVITGLRAKQLFNF
ncbi:amidohydrolase family protein [Sphingomonas immobilis]|uniref:Amidohydrolase family protein n=1 Tax=Sphingomonas immobilis TaxID=3063997 RepID=A0ABT8ZYG3_9SPHN|nr:amidohydrolase family protein [Sphingomonas sp. CA1-15]MDO7842149.1 amidohydrolase family protein [Sphingomonas sp. CA1-15]